jgi:hypothetical protein
MADNDYFVILRFRAKNGFGQYVLVDSVSHLNFDGNMQLELLEKLSSLLSI